jgi:hypothetical protein
LEPPKNSLLLFYAISAIKENGIFAASRHASVTRLLFIADPERKSSAAAGNELRMPLIGAKQHEAAHIQFPKEPFLQRLQGIAHSLP